MSKLQFVINQKIQGGKESICKSCVHRFVCRAYDNQPCIECNHFLSVVRCGECKHSAVDFENRRYCKLVTYYNHVPDDWFCADGERKDGDANVQNWEKNHLRPTNMSGTKCEPCKPTQPECGDCEYIKDGDGE